MIPLSPLEAALGWKLTGPTDVRQSPSGAVHRSTGRWISIVCEEVLWLTGMRGHCVTIQGLGSKDAALDVLQKRGVRPGSSWHCVWAGEVGGLSDVGVVAAMVKAMELDLPQEIRAAITEELLAEGCRG